MITFQEELLRNIKDELLPLQQEHWAERSEVSDKAELNVNMLLFQAIDSTGKLHIVTARDDKKLVGYFVSIISQHPYCTNLIMAENNAIFLSKKYRKGLTGYKLMKIGIEFLKKRADNISISLPSEKKFISIANKLGLKLTNYIFMDIK